MGSQRFYWVMQPTSFLWLLFLFLERKVQNWRQVSKMRFATRVNTTKDAEEFLKINKIKHYEIIVLHEEDTEKEA